MNNKKFAIILFITALATIVILQGAFFLIHSLHASLKAQTVAAKEVGSTIFATGTIHSENEATLHFATGGKLAYLPFKEGDSVQEGQTIAQLDTYALQRQLTAALNNYRSTRDSFDQAQENAQTGVLQGGQKSVLNPLSQSVIGGGDAENTAINDAVKRIVDQNQADLDNSVISVELANYALQLSTLSAPFSGILTQEDITVPNQIITPGTSFSLADPTNLIFRANVSATDIDYLQVDSPAIIQMKGFAVSGRVVKIYPQKITLPTGEQVYQVDLTSPNLPAMTKLGETGSVLIDSSVKGVSLTVPSWSIVGHNHIWVEENGKILLKTITVGRNHGDVTEITGITQSDKIILNPVSVAEEKYLLL